MVFCISNPVYHIAPEMRCAETEDPGSRNEGRDAKKFLENARILRSPEVARLCKRVDEGRAARGLAIGLQGDRSRKFGASSCPPKPPPKTPDGSPSWVFGGASRLGQRFFAGKDL
jgi:hypothetical protein